MFWATESGATQLRIARECPGSQKEHGKGVEGHGKGVEGYGKGVEVEEHGKGVL